MNRRKFLSLLGIGAVAAPVVAKAAMAEPVGPIDIDHILANVQEAPLTGLDEIFEAAYRLKRERPVGPDAIICHGLTDQEIAAIHAKIRQSGLT